MTTNRIAESQIVEIEPLPCQSCHWRNILASIGWFDSVPLFVATLTTEEQSQLLNQAAEKYELTGADLLEAVLRDALK